MKFYATDSCIKKEGRILKDGNRVYLGWSGSSISFSFTGKRAEAKLLSDPENWDEKLLARLAVYIDDEKEAYKRICLDKKEQTLLLYEGEEVRNVTIKLMKYSEAAFGYCGIDYIETDSEELLPPPACKPRRIEIIGDSITCGYGVEAENETIPFHTETENPTKSYSLLTAAALDAEVNLFCWSGNGLTSHYVDPSATEPRTEMLIPELYPYTDRSLSERLYGKDESKWEKWDFASYQPELIMINLGTNDCSWCREIPERNENFKKAYTSFLKDVRRNNPAAVIICMLGMMDARLQDTLPAAVEEYVNESGDKDVKYLPLPLQQADVDGYGADYHPSPSTHKKVTNYILENIEKYYIFG